MVLRAEICKEVIKGKEGGIESRIPHLLKVSDRKGVCSRKFLVFFCLIQGHPCFQELGLALRFLVGFGPALRISVCI